MKEKITAAVKTAYSKYGLKAATITKIVNKMETNISEMGTLEPDKLTEAIQTQIEKYEELAELTQTEADASRVRKPSPVVNDDTDHKSDDLEDILKRVTSPLSAQVSELKAKLDAKDKAEANLARLASIKTLMKEKGATKEPVLQVVATPSELDESLTDEQIVEKLLPKFDSKMKEFYGDAFTPRLPEQGKSKATEQGQKHTETVLDKTISGLGIESEKK